MTFRTKYDKGDRIYILVPNPSEPFPIVKHCIIEWVSIDRNEVTYHLKPIYGDILEFYEAKESDVFEKGEDVVDYVTRKMKEEFAKCVQQS